VISFQRDLQHQVWAKHVALPAFTGYPEAESTRYAFLGWRSLGTRAVCVSASLIPAASHLPNTIRETDKHVRDESKEPVPVEVDGDTTPVDVRSNRRSFQLIVPARRDRA